MGYNWLSQTVEGFQPRSYTRPSRDRPSSKAIPSFSDCSAPAGYWSLRTAPCVGTKTHRSVLVTWRNLEDAVTTGIPISFISSEVFVISSEASCTSMLSMMYANSVTCSNRQSYVPCDYDHEKSDSSFAHGKLPSGSRAPNTLRNYRGPR